MTGHGLNGIHFLTQGQPLTAEYYINMLEKEVNETTDKRKLFSANRHMTFVEDGAPAHVAKANQAWCKKTCQILQRKQAGPQIPQISTLWRIFGAQWMKLSIKNQLLRP